MVFSILRSPVAAPQPLHIPDGFLSAPVAILAWIVTLAFIVVAIRRASQTFDERLTPLMGVLAAFIFAAQAFNFPVAGGTSIVNATSWNAAEDYTVTAAPSMRMVVSLADLDDSRWINLTGVSGHPFDRHYDDQTDLWVDGRTLPWSFSSDAVHDAGEDVLTLRPTSAD